MLTYIASPLRATEPWAQLRNLAFARLAMAHALALGMAPVAPHLLYTQVLDATDADQDGMGIRAATALLASCQALWVYLPTSGAQLSSGIRAELDFWWGRSPELPRTARYWVLRDDIPAEYGLEDGVYPCAAWSQEVRDPAVGQSGLIASFGDLVLPVERAFVPADWRLAPGTEPPIGGRPAFGDLPIQLVARA